MCGGALGSDGQPRDRLTYTYATRLASQICARVTAEVALAAVPPQFERIMTAIKDNVVTPVAVVAEHASHKAKPISVLTNVNLEEREQLLDLGFSVQMMDTASICGLSGDDLDVDIVVLDWSVLDVSSIEATAQFSTRSTSYSLHQQFSVADEAGKLWRRRC